MRFTERYSIQPPLPLLLFLPSFKLPACPLFIPPSNAFLKAVVVVVVVAVAVVVVVAVAVVVVVVVVLWCLCSWLRRGRCWTSESYDLERKTFLARRFYGFLPLPLACLCHTVPIPDVLVSFSSSSIIKNVSPHLSSLSVHQI